MNILDNSLLTTLLTLAATFLGLSVVVQVVQELYKYLRSNNEQEFGTVTIVLLVNLSELFIQSLQVLINKQKYATD